MEVEYRRRSRELSGNRQRIDFGENMKKCRLKMCDTGKKVRAVGAAGQLPTADGLRHFAQCGSDGDRPFEMDTICTLLYNV